MQKNPYLILFNGLQWTEKNRSTKLEEGNFVILKIKVNNNNKKIHEMFVSENLDVFAYKLSGISSEQ